jgi:hypothetical protein
MHVEAHLLDHIGDVESGKGEVLKSPSQATVGGWVADGGFRIGGDLGLSVDRCEAGLAVAHANALKDIPGVLPLESCSGTLEQLRARGGEDNVVDVEEQVCGVGTAAEDWSRTWVEGRRCDRSGM